MRPKSNQVRAPFGPCHLWTRAAITVLFPVGQRCCGEQEANAKKNGGPHSRRLNTSRTAIISGSPPSSTHRDHSHTKTKQNQQGVENCRRGFCSFGCRRFWPRRKFNRNLNLRACAGLETPLRIRLKRSAIEEFVPGALEHSRSGNLARLLIDRD